MRDSDDYLSGDKWWANGLSADRSPQRADIEDGAGGSHSVGRVMNERGHIVEAHIVLIIFSVSDVYFNDYCNASLKMTQ